MKLPLLLTSLALVFVCLFSAHAQRRKQPSSDRVRTGVVIDELLSVLRSKPSLFAAPLQRMRRGRIVQILGATEADGVRFYRVSASSARSGWLQSDAVFVRSRASDEERLARYVEAVNGFDQVQLAATFLEMYPRSRFRPAILLLFGDLLENAAAKLSRDAASRLSRREMAVSGAPAYSYYLNFNMLDRYRRLGVTFLFNPSIRKFHYDGASWREILNRYPLSPEMAEARKRLDALKEKMERKAM